MDLTEEIKEVIAAGYARGFDDGYAKAIEDMRDRISRPLPDPVHQEEELDAQSP